MKRFAAVLAVIMALVLAMAPMCFAGELEFTGVTPKDGEKGKQPSNMAVKLKFSEDMSSEANDEFNKSKIVITGGSENAACDFSIAHSSKYPNELWIIIDGVLESDAEYTVNVSTGLVSTAGNTLETPITTTFRTRNTANDSKISTILIFVMMAVMIFMSTRSAKKQMQEEDLSYQLKKAEAMNPYKIAKQKGISVEEAKAMCDKEKAKVQKAIAKANEEKAKAEAERQAAVAEAAARLDAEYEAERAASLYKVKGPRSIKDAGYSVPKSVTRARKAREEAAKAAEKARKENAKGKKSKK